jgi:multidrug efflux system membrane fusion protein
MNRLRTLLGIGLGIAIVAGAGWYISQSGTTPPARQAGGRFGAGQPTPVGIAAAAKGDVPVVIRALGTVAPLHTVNVKTQITGQLIKVEFKEGQMVKQGDLLAVVDPRPYDVALQQAIGAQQKDEALLKNAQTDLERYTKLVAQDSIARQQLDTQRSLVRQYEAALVMDQAAVDAAKLNVTYTRIVAPITGRIGLRTVDPGNYVTMGDATSICIIIQISPISVLFTIPEDTLPQVRERLKSGASLEVRVLNRAQKNELAVGRLDTHDNIIDTTTGTVKLRAVFDNKDDALFPNQFVNVRLLVDTVKDATVVPVAAIQRGQPGTFVYLVKADDTVEIRVVELGVTDGDRVQIVSGLQPGEQVVIDGTDRLRDGAKIRRPGTAPPRTTAGPPVAAAPPDAQQGGQPQQQQRRRQGNGNGNGGANAGGNGGGSDRAAGTDAGRPAQSNQ